MKKLISLALALLLAFSCAFAEDLFLEEDDLFLEEDDWFLSDDDGLFLEDGGDEEKVIPEKLIVASSTKVSGYFFTNLWGTNTSDMEVKDMLHGLSPVVWTSESEFDTDYTVVKDLRSAENADGSRTYFVTLNENLVYSDGSGIAASDYVFSILLQASPAFKQLGAAETAFTYVKGYEAYHSGETEIFEGVRLLGKYVFSITIDAAFLPFFYEESFVDVTPYPISVLLSGYEVADNLTGAYIKPMDITVVNEDGVETQKGNYTADMLYESIFGANGYMSSPAVTSGPYTLVSYDSASGTVEFVKNENYPGNADGIVPQISEVKLVYMTPNEAMAALANGEVQLVSKCVSQSAIAVGMASSAQMTTYPRRGLGYVAFACEDEILSDVNVRKAITAAFDRTSFVSEYLGGFGIEAYGYYGIGQWMAQAATGAVQLEDLSEEEQEQWDSVTLESLKTVDYDLDAAAAYLDAAGWLLGEDGLRYKDGTPLTLTFAKTTGSGAAEKVAEYLTSALESLGVELEVVEIGFDEVLADLYNAGEREYDMYFLGSNFNVVFDPSITFSTDETYFNTANVTHIKDETLESLALDMRATEPGDVLEYYLKWYAFQQRVSELCPILPIYSDVYVDFYDEFLQDYDINAAQGWASAIVNAWFGEKEEEIIEEELFEEDDDMLF